MGDMVRMENLKMHEPISGDLAVQLRTRIEKDNSLRVEPANIQVHMVPTCFKRHGAAWSGIMAMPQSITVVWCRSVWGV